MQAGVLPAINPVTLRSVTKTPMTIIQNEKKNKSGRKCMSLTCPSTHRHRCHLMNYIHKMSNTVFSLESVTQTLYGIHVSNMRFLLFNSQNSSALSRVNIFLSIFRALLWVDRISVKFSIFNSRNLPLIVSSQF